MLGTAVALNVADFADDLHRAPQEAGGLLVVGTPDDEPWHFVAHLADEAGRWGAVRLVPTWLRWQAPAGAPAHLAVTVDRLGSAGRNETVLVVGDRPGQPQLLERVVDARRRGATIMAVHAGDGEIEELAHEAVTVDPCRLDPAEHLISVLAPAGPGAATRGRRRSLAARLLHR